MERTYTITVTSSNVDAEAIARDSAREIAEGIGESGDYDGTVVTVAEVRGEDVFTLDTYVLDVEGNDYEVQFTVVVNAADEDAAADEARTLIYDPRFEPTSVNEVR